MPENAAKPPGSPAEGGSKPSRIGGFELLATLGKGGMGTVFKARQVSMDRVVALKVLPPNLAKNQDFVQRFLREARSAAKLNHPNIVQGIDVGEADGVYYFAMEFVDGPTLKDLLKREGRLDEKKALNIIGGVARALEHAHKHGIVHRDIKPDNIMISRDGVVKLADLGLARSILPQVSDPSSLPRVSDPREGTYAETVTLDGTALGTPHYMAPEQARGEADLDTRADIYALGATLFHAVTGEFPYTAPNAGALMAKHITEPVPNPKDRNPALSRPVCDLIQHMMAKDREDRPQTPSDLLSEIRDALEGKIKLHRPTSPRPSPRAARYPVPSVHPVHSVHPPKRRPALPWAIAAAALLAAGALFLLLRPGNPVQPQAREKEDRTAKDAKTSSLPRVSDPREGKAGESVAQAQADRQLAELKSACAALAAKDQFAQALARIDAFLANTLPRVSNPREGTSSLPRVPDPREGTSLIPKVSDLREGILRAAEERYAALARSADAAIEAKDYPKARAALRPAESFGIPDLADRAKKKLEEIASREKSAEAWAKWDGVKSQAKKLSDAGQFGEAAKLLDGAKAIPLDHIADQIAEQTQAIEDARRAAAEKAAAAYAAESDKVWALFKERKYADADKLLADLASNLPRVPNPREVITGPLAADQEAAKLLKEFWAAVEKGLAAKAGQFLSFKGAAGGTLLSVQDGAATIKTPKGEEPRRVQDLVAKQALAHADLKDDPHSYLLKGVFLLAEGEELPKAEEAFDKAGDETNVARYKERLAALAPPKVATPTETTPKVQPGPTRKWVVYKEWPFGAAEAVRRQKAAAQALGADVEQDIDLGGGAKMTFVLIPAGEFLMGSPPTTSPEKLAATYGGDPKEYKGEFPQHRVRISKPFWLGKYEVVQEQWQPLMGSNPSEDPGLKKPVGKVSWADCQGFIKAFNQRFRGGKSRLPTEAEWEYACRAGTSTQFFFGNDALHLGEYGWRNPYVSWTTHPVGELKPNAWGLYDLAGNVWEWCEDPWHETYERAPRDGSPWLAGGDPGNRIIRGGSMGDWNPACLRSAFRNKFGSEKRQGYIGFRVVVDRFGGGEVPAEELPKVAAENLKTGKWESLFDGKSLKGWAPVEGGRFSTLHTAEVKDGAIFLPGDKCWTGLKCTEALPKIDYELEADVRRVERDGDFFYLVFPAGGEECTFVVGGWRGTVVGLDLVDGVRADANGTRSHAKFEVGPWYTVRLRVTKDKVEAWVDKEKVVDLKRAGHQLSLSPEFAPAAPLAICATEVKTAVRNIRLRRLGE